MATVPEKPAIPVISSRVNLDEVFGYPFENVISEPVTPYKLVIAELIQLINELDPAEDVLFREEAIMAHSIIYGMINREEDMSFDDVKRCVRHMNKYMRKVIGIYELFMMKMDIKVRSEEKKPFFLQIAHGSDPKQKEAVLRDFGYKSPIRLFVQKLYVATCNLTQQQLFEMDEQMRLYIRGELKVPQPGDKNYIHPEIRTSLKARQWIKKQLHLLQLCPSDAMEENNLIGYCKEILKFHPDIPDVHLLEMLIHIIREDGYKAQECLRRFFDFSVFRPFLGGSTPMPAGCSRLGVPDQRPFRYGPLLAARLYRMFGDRQLARALLHECLREAQSLQDHICSQLVHLEYSIILSTEISKIDKVHERHRSQPTTRVELEGEAAMNSFIPVFEVYPAALADRDPEEHVHSLELQLSSARSYSDEIISFKKLGKYNYTFVDLDQDPKVSWLDDKDAKARSINDACLAMMTTYKLFQGQCTSAKNSADALVLSNSSDGIASKHETEAFFIAIINSLYVRAIRGEWNEVISSITEMYNKYFPRLYNKVNKQIKLAYGCLHFNNHFRLGQYDDCEHLLTKLEPCSYQEWFLRKVLLLCQRGHILVAFESLVKEIEYLDREQAEFYYSVRVRMMQIVVEAYLRNTAYHDYSEKFEQILLMIRDCKGLGGMVRRRLAVVCFLTKDYKTADEFLDIIMTEGDLAENPLELGLASFLHAQVYKKLKRPFNAVYNALQMASKRFDMCKYYLLQKYVYKQMVELIEEDKLIEKLMDEEMNTMLERFIELDDEYPGYQEWIFI